MWIGEGHEEIFFPVLDDHINKVFKIGFAVEYLALAVDNVFLEIKCNVFCYAEVLHRIRYGKSHLFTDPEKMINSGFGCENDRCEIGDIDLLLPEILCRDPLNLDKLFEVYLQIVFFCELEIW